MRCPIRRGLTWPRRTNPRTSCRVRPASTLGPSALVPSSPCCMQQRGPESPCLSFSSPYSSPAGAGTRHHNVGVAHDPLVPTRSCRISSDTCAACFIGRVGALRHRAGDLEGVGRGRLRA
jgi:hypothetical protein